MRLNRRQFLLTSAATVAAASITAPAFAGEAIVIGIPAAQTGPVGVATSLSACTLVKPLADNHCSTCSAVVLPGSSTGKVKTNLGSPAASARLLSSA